MTNQPIHPTYAVDEADEAVAARVQFLLQSQPRVLIAIDGNCSAGKTTAADHLGARLGAALFHLDDYFLQPHMRTPERLGQPGGNVDAERFLAEVLAPISRGEAATVRKYDCQLDRLLNPVSVAPAAVCIIEGAYSLHPLLAPYYDVKLFYTIDPALQIERIRRRNGEELLPMFINRWIPLENTYFSALKIEQICDFVIESTQH